MVSIFGKMMTFKKKKELQQTICNTGQKERKEASQFEKAGII